MDISCLFITTIFPNIGDPSRTWLSQAVLPLPRTHILCASLVEHESLIRFHKWKYQNEQVTQWKIRLERTLKSNVLVENAPVPFLFFFFKHIHSIRFGEPKFGEVWLNFFPHLLMRLSNIESKLFILCEYSMKRPYFINRQFPVVALEHKPSHKTLDLQLIQLKDMLE